MMHNCIQMNRQLGLTLLEMLVAMLLSAILLGGVIQVFSSNKKMFSFQEGVAAIQNHGRYAMLLLGYQFRQAGFVENPETNLKQAFIEGVEDEDGDEITIRYESTVDCLGHKTKGIAVNRFFIGIDSDGVPSLMCQGNAGKMAAADYLAAQPLIPNVEKMEILYGVDKGLVDFVADRYVGYDEITNGNYDYEEIVSVQIGLLIASPGPVRNQADKTTFELPGRQWTEDRYNTGDLKNDRKLRKTFTSTFTLRNQVNTGSVP